MDLAGRRSGRFPVQYGAGHRGDVDQRRPRPLARRPGRRNPPGGRPPCGRSHGSRPRFVSHARDLRRLGPMTDWTSHFPETVTIQPLERPPHATVRVPGSKSISNRALILAALSHPAKGSELRGLLQSEDTEVMIDALRALDIRVRTAGPEQVVHVRRGMFGRIIPAEAADLFVANSGTSMRFLTALVSLGQGRYRIDGVSRMRERPIADLLDALRQLGVQASSEQQNGYPPVVIQANGLSGGRVRIPGDVRR